MAVVTLSVYFSPAFTVKKISVEGAHRLTSERLTELAAVPASSTLLRLDVEDIQKRVASDPWVKSVEVKRSFPETVVLVVEEREIAVVAEVSLSTSNTKVTNWLISTDGIWLGNFESPVSVVDTSEGVEGEGSDGSAAGDGAAEDETAAAAGGAEGETGTAEEGQTAPDAATTPASGASLLDGVLVTSSEVDKLIHIKDTSHSIAPGIGQLVNDEGVANALALINGFSPEMLGLIHSISAPDRINTTLTLDNYVLVAFGAAEDVAAKEKAILKLLAEHEDQLTYINVRVADRATYRATG
jgi:cell division protein FtsQ